MFEEISCLVLFAAVLFSWQGTVIEQMSKKTRQSVTGVQPRASAQAIWNKAPTMTIIQTSGPLHPMHCSADTVLFYATNWPMHLKQLSQRPKTSYSYGQMFLHKSPSTASTNRWRNVLLLRQSLSGDFSVLSACMLMEKRYLGCGLIWACLAKIWISDGKTS